MMKKFSLGVSLIVLLTGLFILSSCQEQTPQAATQLGEKEKKIVVYTSFYPMYDFTKKIGGDKVEITNMVPAGIEPHEWEPAPKALASLSKAQIFIYNGAGMEAWVDKILNSLGNNQLVVVESSKGIKYLENKDEGEDLKYDPHTWLSPLNAKKQMENIRNALQKVDPANKDYYQKNYQINAQKLNQLQQEYTSSLARYKKRAIVVAHQAFGYLCSTYGLEQVAIVGLNAHSEPTPAKMSEIAQFAQDQQVKYIFFEELISPKVSEAIAKQVGAKTEMLNPLEGLSIEEMQAGKEYFAVMRDNLRKLEKALQ